MDWSVVLVILALAATVIVMLFGLMSMGGGGRTDKIVSTPLMWSRIALQSVTILLLLLALWLR